MNTWVVGDCCVGLHLDIIKDCLMLCIFVLFVCCLLPYIAAALYDILLEAKTALSFLPWSVQRPKRLVGCGIKCMQPKFKLN